MPYHSEEIIVQEDDFDGSFILPDRAQFLQGHLEAAVTNYSHNCFIRFATLCTKGSRQSESHGPESPAGNNTPAVLELEVAVGDHLVLSNICDQDSLPLGFLSDHPDHFSHGQSLLLRMDIFFYYFFIFILVGNFKLVQPLLMLVLFDKGKDGLKTFLDISDYSDISPDIFIYLGRIDLEVYYFGQFAVGLYITCDTVIESHSQSDQQVAFVGFYIGTVIPVHAKHSYVQGVLRGHGGIPKQGPCCRDLGFLDKCHQFLFCT